MQIMVHNLNSARCCSMTSVELFTPDILRIMLSWSCSVRMNGAIFLLNIVQQVLEEVIAAKEISSVLKIKES